MIRARTASRWKLVRARTRRSSSVRCSAFSVTRAHGRPRRGTGPLHHGFGPRAKLSAQPMITPPNQIFPAGSTGCTTRLNMPNLRGQLDEAVELGARAMEIAGTLGDTGLRIRTSAVLAQTHLFRGEFGARGRPSESWPEPPAR